MAKVRQEPKFGGIFGVYKLKKRKKMKKKEKKILS